MSTTLIEDSFAAIYENKKLTKLRGDELLNEENKTIINCRYISKHEYGDGGWVSISENTYLVNAETGECLQLLQAIGIPLSPKCFYFNQPGQEINFTLLFPKLPPSWHQFHLIEEDSGAIFENRYIKSKEVGTYSVEVI